MSAFGFNVDNVFGTARKGTKKKSKRKRDSMDSMMGESLGIDTFSLADPNIDALSLGSDFGSQVGSRAGLSNGKGGGFLDIIGQQQSRVGVARVTGKGRIASGRGRGRAKVGRKRSSPLQSRTGSSFGNVDRAFAGNVIGNVRGAKKRIQAFRDKRKRSKTKSTQERPALPPPPAQQLRQPERPALPPPRSSSLGLTPSERGSSSIQRLREEAESRSAT